jgi:hypothetical protein
MRTEPARANRVTMKLTIRAIVISMASVASIAQAQQSSPRPTNVGATTAQPDTGSEKKVADPVDAYINSSTARQHIPGLSLVIIRCSKKIDLDVRLAKLSVPANSRYP